MIISCIEIERNRLVKMAYYLIIPKEKSLDKDRRCVVTGRSVQTGTYYAILSDKPEPTSYIHNFRYSHI